MDKANVTVMKRATLLWMASGLVLGLNIFAAYRADIALIYAALAITGAFALVGIAFGLWAARAVTRASATPR